MNMFLHFGIVSSTKRNFFPFQDWLAFTQGAGQLTFQGKLQFENGGAPLEQDNFAFCKVMIKMKMINPV